jgi:hypothetical protein
MEEKKQAAGGKPSPEAGQPEKTQSMPAGGKPSTPAKTNDPALPKAVSAEVPQKQALNHRRVRKPTAKDYLLTALLLVVLIWELGLLDLALEYSNTILKASQPVSVIQRFHVVTPIGGIDATPALDTLTAVFQNSGTDPVTVKTIEVYNMRGSRPCAVQTRLPLVLERHDILNLTASGCGISESSPGTGFSFGVILKGQTTLRSVFTSDDAMVSPVSGVISEEQKENLRQQRVEQLRGMKEADKVLELTSSGKMTGIYAYYTVVSEAENATADAEPQEGGPGAEPDIPT